MSVKGILSLFSFCDVCGTVWRSFEGRDNGLFEQLKQDSHICRRSRAFPLILRKNQSHHKKDNEV